MNCREADGLGFSTFACPDHPSEIRTIPHSCKSRFCSVCAKIQSDKWVADINQNFPNCPYLHVTFTVPEQFRVLLFEKRELLNAVFIAGTETLLSFCREQGFLPAITAVLHTFGSDLKRHVHIHVIISAGGLKLSGKAERYTRYKKRKEKKPRAKMKKVFVRTENPEWVSWNKFPYPMLHKRYQALLIKYLKEYIQKNITSENPDEELMVFSDPRVVKTFFDDLIEKYENGFYVHITDERIDLKQTAAYIGRYARRPPISELRIKNYTGEYVTYEFKDYKNNGSKVLHTLKTQEFIRRLVRHIPPHYFNVIRHYGLSASRVRSTYKKIIDKLLGKSPYLFAIKNWRERQTAFRGNDPLQCRICGKDMIYVSNHRPNSLSAIRIKLQIFYL